MEKKNIIAGRRTADCCNLSQLQSLQKPAARNKTNRLKKTTTVEKNPASCRLQPASSPQKNQLQSAYPGPTANWCTESSCSLGPKEQLQSAIKQKPEMHVWS